MLIEVPRRRIVLGRAESAGEVMVARNIDGRNGDNGNWQLATGVAQLEAAALTQCRSMERCWLEISIYALQLEIMKKRLTSIILATHQVHRVSVQTH